MSALSGLISNCKKFFGTKNLYNVLKISEEAKDSELKKAYYKLSLEVHPDRVKEENKENATEKFQVLGKVYAILSDKERRAVYDETGEIDEENHLSENKDWQQYWRTLFKKISLADIEKFSNDYKGSEEELSNLEEAYLDGEGNMDYILSNVLCAQPEDEDRFEKLLSDWIESGRVPPLDKFTKQTKKQKSVRKRKAGKEAAEAEQLKQELGFGSGASLEQMIALRSQERGAQMDSFFDSLAEKYAPKKGKKKK